MQSIGFDTYTTNVMTSIPKWLKKGGKKSQAHTHRANCVHIYNLVIIQSAD